MHIISVSDFGLWKNTEERGVEDSRSTKTTGVYRVFFRLHSARTRILYSPCKLTNQDTSSYEPPGAVSMHPPLKAPIIEGQADKIRRDGRADEEQPRIDVRNTSAKSQDQGCPSKGGD